jgi:hypothetical protein
MRKFCKGLNYIKSLLRERTYSEYQKIYFSKLGFPCPILQKVLRIFFCTFYSLNYSIHQTQFTLKTFLYLAHFDQPELSFAKLYEFYPKKLKFIKKLEIRFLKSFVAIKDTEAGDPAHLPALLLGDGY